MHLSRGVPGKKSVADFEGAAHKDVEHIFNDEFREEQKTTTDHLVENYSRDELLKMRQMLEKTSSGEFFKFSISFLNRNSSSLYY